MTTQVTVYSDRGEFEFNDVRKYDLLIKRECGKFLLMCVVISHKDNRISRVEGTNLLVKQTKKASK